MTKIYNIIILLIISLSTSAQWQQVGNSINGIAENDNSAYSISLNSEGNIIAISSPYNDDFQTDAGLVKMYKEIGGVWSQIGNNIYGEAENDNLGFSVSMNADGTIVAIGASNNDGNGTDAGHVRIYKNISDVWTQVGSDIEGEAAENYSGYSISINSDGTIVAIGAVGNNANGMYSGNVRVFQFNGTDWLQIGSNISGDNSMDYFGFAVDINSIGDVVVIGSPYFDGVNGNSTGSAKVYKNISDTWTQIGANIEGEGSYDYFGHSVSINSDGNIIAIGAHYNDGNNGTDSGHVRIFENNSGTWQQIGSNIDGENEDDQSGQSVSINDVGNVVAIGAYYNSDNGNSSGQVRVFKNNLGTWQHIGSDIDGENEMDVAGFSVSINASGTRVAIGAIQNDNSFTDAGNVRIFENDFSNIKTLTNDDISIFPNPVYDILNCKTENETIKNISIYDILGKKIFNKKVNSKTEQINVSHLNNGIYFVEIQTNIKTSTSCVNKVNVE